MVEMMVGIRKAPATGHSAPHLPLGTPGTGGPGGELLVSITEEIEEEGVGGRSQPQTEGGEAHGGGGGDDGGPGGDGGEEEEEQQEEEEEEEEEELSSATGRKKKGIGRKSKYGGEMKLVGLRLVLLAMCRVPT